MNIYIGCDHAAFEAKEILKAQKSKMLSEVGSFVDCGTFSSAPCDYPDWVLPVVKHIQRGEGKGLLLCGSGIGVSMVANRYAFIRAALCRTPQEAKISVEHNDSNILCLGTRISSLQEIQAIGKAWIEGHFSGTQRHRRRIDKFNHLGEKL